MERIPKSELKKVIDAQFNYDRRKYIFWSFNSTYFGIALFQIYSDVNIEGGENPALCIDTPLTDSKFTCPPHLYSSLVALIIAHLCQLFAATIGYFGIDQKSRKLNKSYSYLIVISYLFDLIVSIVLCTQYGDLGQTPFKNTRNEFLMLLITFPIIQGFMSYFCLSQFKRATQENFIIQNVKDEVLDRHPSIIQDVVKLFL